MSQYLLGSIGGRKLGRPEAPQADSDDWVCADCREPGREHSPAVSAAGGGCGGEKSVAQRPLRSEENGKANHHRGGRDSHPDSAPLQPQRRGKRGHHQGNRGGARVGKGQDRYESNCRDRSAEDPEPPHGVEGPTERHQYREPFDVGELEAVEEQPADHEAVGATRSALVNALERDSRPAKSGEGGRLRPEAEVLKRREATGEQQHPAAGQAENRPLPRPKDSERESGDRNTQPVRGPRQTSSGRPTAG